MFKKIKFRNFKSFSDLTFDLVSRGKSKNIVAIYGENGSGKSNIVDAFKLLRFSMDTMRFSKQLTAFQAKLQEANDKDKLPDVNELADLFFGGRISMVSFSELSKTTHRISAEGNTKLEFYFNMGDNDGVYILEYNDKGELMSESLDYIINSNKGNHFKIERNTEITASFSKSIFKKGLFKDLQEQAEKFWGKHTFLSIYRDYIDSLNADYAKRNVSKNFIKVIEEFGKILIWTDSIRGPFRDNKMMLNDLDKGEISSDEKDKLLQTEEIIYKFFSTLYTDIKDVRYNLDEEGNSIKYELIIHKNIGGGVTEVPISLESNGTKNLLELLIVFFWVVDGRVCIVDEIDSGIHDILMNSILGSLSDCVSGQLIFTTHDTALLKELNPSSAYFMTIDVNGNKKIKSGNDADKKVGTNNNMEKLYLDGFFGAVPDPLDLDFKELFSNSDEFEA